ncbi:hypothetical protein ACFYYS_29365 [Streptomyces sp. NPDC002120]|uniref:hypothetical protein n=1 Tax=Streptomyces sp. NPDC002120 TaxID=3364631 RepID=UPI00367D8A1D
MTATRTRRLAPLLIATLLAGGAASISSTAIAAPTTTSASVTTDTDADSPRPVKHIAKTPRTVKSIPKTPRTSGGMGGSREPGEGYGLLEGGSAGNGVPFDEWENVMWSTDREMSKVHNEL